MDNNTPVGPLVVAARDRINRNTQSWSVFMHPMRGDFTPKELAAFVGIFETCKLTETEATRAALAAVAAIEAAEKELA